MVTQYKPCTFHSLGNARLYGVPQTKFLHKQTLGPYFQTEPFLTENQLRSYTCNLPDHLLKGCRPPLALMQNLNIIVEGIQKNPKTFYFTYVNNLMKNQIGRAHNVLHLAKYINQSKQKQVYKILLKGVMKMMRHVKCTNIS